MKIKIYNDGRGRSQSYEAWISEMVGLNEFYVIGYGYTEQEAIDDLTKGLITFVNEVNKVVTDYQQAGKEYVKK